MKVLLKRESKNKKRKERLKFILMNRKSIKIGIKKERLSLKRSNPKSKEYGTDLHLLKLQILKK